MIKNVIFDFGNVLFDLELEKLKSGFLNLMDDKGKKVLQLHTQSGLFKRYEKGEISSDTFVESLRRSSRPPVSKEAIIAVWNSIFVDFPKERLDMLLELRKTYKVFLLSNINDLHLRWIWKYLEEKHGITDFERRFFDGVYYSHLVGMRKPDSNIYAHILSDADIIAEESIFFDDLEENIEAAEALGIQGAHHVVGREIREHVRARGIL